MKFFNSISAYCKNHILAVKTNMVFAALFVFLILADRVTKRLAVLHLMKADVPVIPGVLELHYLENRGAAWGIFPDAQWFFIAITVIVVAIMIYVYGKIPFAKRFLYFRCILIIMSAGAIGNFIDRITQHYVVDFIYLKCINFPVFNIADCFVCIAAVLLLHSILFVYKDENLL